MSIQAPITTISIADRGLQYGDGCFSTIKVTARVPQHLQLHIERLRWGLSSLAIEGVNFSGIQSEILDKAKTLTTGVIKVTVTRGEGGRGYSPPSITKPNWWLSCHQLPQHYLTQEQEDCGLALHVSDIKLAKQPLLAGFKHLNRLEQVLIKQQIERHGWQDALVLDQDQKIVETSSANLFWQTGDRLFTPSIEQSGIKGIARCVLIRALAEQGIQVHRVSASLKQVLAAQTVFVCNSLMGLRAVKCIENTEYDNPHFARIRNIYLEYNAD